MTQLYQTHKHGHLTASCPQPHDKARPGHRKQASSVEAECTDDAPIIRQERPECDGSLQAQGIPSDAIHKPVEPSTMQMLQFSAVT